MNESKEDLAKGGFEGFVVFVLVFAFLSFYFVGFVLAADPVGPDTYESISNSTKATVGNLTWNISGGYISKFNLTATTQDYRWKAFVGNMTGSFTLDDASGSTIFDWTLTSVTGRIYATRNSSEVQWTEISCSNLTLMEQENSWLSHSNVDDNISATFDQSDHDPFNVAGTNIDADSCPTLSTYVNNASQAQGADVFEEMVLIDSVNTTVYATILENDVAGYDGQQYDFQMLVPENGSAAWNSQIPYYIYVELG